METLPFSCINYPFNRLFKIYFLLLFIMSSQVINAQHVPQKRSDENREIKEVIIKFKDSDNLRLLVNNGSFLKDNINQICERFGNFSASRLKSNDISTSSRVKRPRVHSYITVSYESGMDTCMVVRKPLKIKCQR